MVVRAPFDGIAISKDAQPGEMISPVSAGGGFTRTGICTIVDMASLEIEVDVSETYINRVHPRAARGGGARRLPGLDDSGARDHDDPVGRPTEGDRQGADRIRPARSAHPARHGRQGVVPAGRGTRRRGGVRGAADGRAEGGRPHGGRPDGGVRGEGRPRRAPRGHASATRTAARWTCCRASTAGERVVLDAPATMKDGDRIKVQCMGAR